MASKPRISLCFPFFILFAGLSLHCNKTIAESTNRVQVLFNQNTMKGFIINSTMVFGPSRPKIQENWIGRTLQGQCIIIDCSVSQEWDKYWKYFVNSIKRFLQSNGAFFEQPESDLLNINFRYYSTITL